MNKKETIKFILSLKLKELRTTLGMSLKDLAKRSGVSISYLNEIEKAKKYPKTDKLMILAEALGVNFNHLISTETSPKLKPLIDFFEEDFLNRLPLKEFGISKSDLFDVMSYSPEKFSSFLVTMSQIVRMYGLQFNDINKAALRAYQQTHLNYFEEIENQAQDFIKLKGWEGRKEFGSKELIEILVSQYDYSVDFTRLSKIPELENSRSIFKQGKPNKLLINPKLSERQKVFVLARELGHCLFKHKRLKITGSDTPFTDYEELFNDYKASYFAGALLIQKELIIEDLKGFFNQNSFSSEELQNIMLSYETGSEVFFHRLSQIIPTFFGLNNLFFLRSNHNKKTDTYNISKEMHLSQLHKPHASQLGEHYCRRWITISLFQDYLEQNSEYLINAQFSKMLESDEKYLCLSMVRPSRLKPDTNSCITIGIQVNNSSREKIHFIDDPTIQGREVGQTCERCSILDCKERVAEPRIYKKEKIMKDKKESLQKILADL
jgi:transcriptional regulator with XRE-family HTH domain/Zn-dependent peptidase ImmA (M78 family)